MFFESRMASRKNFRSITNMHWNRPSRTYLLKRVIRSWSLEGIRGLMRTFRNAFIVCLLSALVGAAGVRAQQQSSQQAAGQTQEQPDAPIPAYHSPLASQSGSQDDQTANDSQKIVPDNRSLAGAQELSLGSPETSRSYWQPHVDVTGTADSNALGGNTGWTTYTTILGGIDLHKISGHSDLTAGYA